MQVQWFVAHLYYLPCLLTYFNNVQCGLQERSPHCLRSSFLPTLSFTTPVPNNHYKEVRQSCSVHSWVPQLSTNTQTIFYGNIQGIKILKCSRATNFLYPLIIKANEMHNLSNLFDKVLYMFLTGPLSIIRSIATMYTRYKYLSG
jgi:hypothetical protein